MDEDNLAGVSEELKGCVIVLHVQKVSQSLVCLWGQQEKCPSDFGVTERYVNTENVDQRKLKLSEIFKGQ